MERLRKKDAEAGIVNRPLSDEQKAAIAEVRSLYDSKIAEQHVLQESALRGPAGAASMDLSEVAAPFRRERERLERERDAKVERIREGKA